MFRLIKYLKRLCYYFFVITLKIMYYIILFMPYVIAYLIAFTILLFRILTILYEKIIGAFTKNKERNDTTDISLESVKKDADRIISNKAIAIILAIITIALLGYAVGKSGTQYINETGNNTTSVGNATETPVEGNTNTTESENVQSENQQTENPKTENIQEKIDYSNLETISLSSIKSDLEKGLSNVVKDKYVGNSYIFTATVDEICDGYFRTPVEGHSGCKMYMNNQELDKLQQLKVGDTVKCCGKMKKIGIYYTIVFENVSIIE